MAQTEAAMMQKKPIEFSDDAQSIYNAAGDRKSPELRAAERTSVNREKVAQTIGQYLYDNGISSTDIKAAASDPAASELFWNNTGRIPGASAQEHYVPSGQTRSAVLDYLKGLEKSKAPAQPAPVADLPPHLANNPKAAAAARAMVEEMGKTEPQVGAAATLRNGKSVIIKKINLDGTFEY